MCGSGRDDDRDRSFQRELYMTDGASDHLTHPTFPKCCTPAMRAASHSHLRTVERRLSLSPEGEGDLSDGNDHNPQPTARSIPASGARTSIMVAPHRFW